MVLSSYSCRSISSACDRNFPIQKKIHVYVFFGVFNWMIWKRGVKKGMWKMQSLQKAIIKDIYSQDILWDDCIIRLFLFCLYLTQYIHSCYFSYTQNTPHTHIYIWGRCKSVWVGISVWAAKIPRNISINLAIDNIMKYISGDFLKFGWT